jgi:hypothetical protein
MGTDRGNAATYLMTMRQKHTPREDRWRERLWIESNNFSVERFRVKDIDDVIAQIRAATNLS